MSLNCFRADFQKINYDKSMNEQGFLRLKGFATRTGVFEYYDANSGETRKEFRSPEEVFNSDSMRSLAESIVTKEHPPKMIDSENVHLFEIGHCSSNVRKMDNKLETDLVITRPKGIEYIESGNQELSCGYTADVEKESGVSPDGEKYDYVQKNIKYNHLAIVSEGRAGPDVKLRMDRYDAKKINNFIKNGETVEMAKRKDMVEEEKKVSDMEAMKKNMDAMQKKIDEMSVEFEKSKKDEDKEMPKEKEDYEQGGNLERDNSEKISELESKKDEDKEMPKIKKEDSRDKLDKMQAEIDSLRHANKSRVDAKNINILVEKRAKLKRFAEKNEVKYDSEMSDRKIQEGIIKKYSGDSIDLSKKSAVYIEARFDHIAETSESFDEFDRGQPYHQTKEDSAIIDIKEKSREDSKNYDFSNSDIGISKTSYLNR